MFSHKHTHTQRNLFSYETTLAVAIIRRANKCKADTAASGRFTATYTAQGEDTNPHLCSYLAASNYSH